MHLDGFGALGGQPGLVLELGAGGVGIKYIYIYYIHIHFLWDYFKLTILLGWNILRDEV